MARILLIDPQKTTQSVISELLPDDEVRVKLDANQAIEDASEFNPDLILLELSLAGHSGLEFLYEFRTYNDWISTPIIIYSSLKLKPNVLKSKSWEHLNICDYYYKPETSLQALKKAVERALV